MSRFVCVLLASAALVAAETKLGQTLTLQDPITVDQLTSSARTLVGQKIQVRGKVTEVCQMAGCWMQLAGTGKNSVRIKVNDGDIVFPESAIGKVAVAEGTLQKFDLTRQQAIARARHDAEERGIAFKPASVKSGTTIYQLQGTGALILE